MDGSAGHDQRGGGVMAHKEPFYGRWHGNKVRRRWWSFLNWIKGYKWCAVQRFRCCDHTTPYHSAWCTKRNRELGVL